MNIDLKKVRNANCGLSQIIWNLSAQKKHIYVLRRRLSAEVCGRRNIGERLDAILREIDKAEGQIYDIYRVTERAVTQYANMEAKLTANASRFM